MKHLWIIDDISSTTIFYRKYSVGKEIDPDLVSGLLSALHQFSEVELDQHGIESITMGGLAWTYVDNKDYDMLFICADDKTTNPHIMKSRLEAIRNAFLQQYNLTPEIWKKKWNGDVTEYQDFSEITDTYIRDWKEAEKIVNVAELFDLLGVFQQIFNLILNIIRLNFFNQEYEQITTEINNKLKATINSEEFSQEDELKKIEFFNQTGWNIITINPANVSASILQKALLTLTKSMKDIISVKLGKMLTLHSLSQEVFPYLLSNWNLISSLNMEKKILSLFLT